MIGDHRKTEAFKGRTEILREAVGGQGQGNDGNGGGHAAKVHLLGRAPRGRDMPRDLGAADGRLKGKRRFPLRGGSAKPATWASKIGRASCRERVCQNV